MRLFEFAVAKPGQILSRVISSENTGISTKVLVPRAISAGCIITDNIEEQMLSQVVSEEKYTHEGDVVIKLSGPYDSVYIQKENEGYLLPSFCAAIRILTSEVDPKYLTAYLNTSAVKQQLANIAGGIRPMIRLSDLNELEVPVLNENDMRDLGETYQLSSLKREKLRKLIKAEEDLMDGIIVATIKGG